HHRDNCYHIDNSRELLRWSPAERVPPIESGRVLETRRSVEDVDVEVEALRVGQLALLGVRAYEASNGWVVPAVEVVYRPVAWLTGLPVNLSFDLSELNTRSNVVVTLRTDFAGELF